MNNKIIFLNFLPGIDSTYLIKGGVYPCTASMLLGTYLKQNGFDVTIIDGAYHENYLDMLRRSLSNDVLYVGMTVMTTQIPFALEASKLIKSVNSNIKVVWGGAHPTLFPETTLKNQYVDIVVVNEGTQTSLNLAKCYRGDGDLTSVNGIGYKEISGAIRFTESAPLDDIDEIPFFDFSLIELNNYLYSAYPSVYEREFPDFHEKIRLLPILTALGCPYKCQFCFNVITKRKYRIKPAYLIVQEIKRLQSIYDVNTFFFLDEDFFINKKRVLEFVDLVEKENLHFNWRMWCRVDHFNENYINNELINRLAAIGHGSLVMGAESANQEILDALCKGITPEQIKNSLRTITGTRITPRYSFMVGLENESIEQIKNTYRFCLELLNINPDVDIANPFIFRLYPGSPIFERITKKFNLRIPHDLEEWVDFLKKESTYTYIPWTPEKFQKIVYTQYYLLSFYTQYALSRISDRKNLSQDLASRLIYKLAKFRVKYFIFDIPFEYWFIHRDEIILLLRKLGKERK